MRSAAIEADIVVAEIVEPCGDLAPRLARIEGLLSAILDRLGDADEMITEREAAELRGLTVFCLRRERREGRGPQWVQSGSRAIRYSRKVVESYIAAQTVNPRKSHEPNFA